MTLAYICGSFLHICMTSRHYKTWQQNTKVGERRHRFSDFEIGHGFSHGSYLNPLCFLDESKLIANFTEEY